MSQSLLLQVFVQITSLIQSVDKRVAIPSITGLRSNIREKKDSARDAVAIPSITGLRSNWNAHKGELIESVAIPSITGLRSNGSQTMDICEGIRVAIPSITGLRSNKGGKA